MQNIKCDIIIVGAGPAGATMALMLAGSGLQVTVVDKDRFPRNKICGDALSGKVVSILKRMPGSIYNDFLASVPKTPSFGIRFVSPGFHSADIPFSNESNTEPSGYICPRREFDAFLVSKLYGHADIRVLEGHKVVTVDRTGSGITVSAEHTTITAKLAVGADGVHSVLRSRLSQGGPARETLSTGIRAYFEGVTGFPVGGFIELFFFRDLLPFYFWIFPGVNGRCNAGLAMMQQQISGGKHSLGNILETIIRTHPLIAPRFAHSHMTGRPEAHSLPLGMPAGPFSGDRFLLLGDAASLVDPFTGEGIGNGMASGEVAARVVKMCFEKGDLSAKALKEYDRQLIRRTGTELRISSTLHRMARYPWLFDFIVKKVNINKAFRLLPT